MKWTSCLLLFLAGFELFGQGVNQDLFDQINSIRRKRFLPELVYADNYQTECDNWSIKLSKNFGHSFYSWHHLSECVSINFPRQDIINDFMDSKPHKKALMDRAAKYVCIGTYQSASGQPIHTTIRTYQGDGSFLKK